MRSRCNLSYEDATRHQLFLNVSSTAGLIASPRININIGSQRLTKIAQTDIPVIVGQPAVCTSYKGGRSEAHASGYTAVDLNNTCHTVAKTNTIALATSPIASKG